MKVLELANESNWIAAVVLKVDTGETITVPIRELKQLPETYQHPSGCAFRCSLPLKQSSKNRSKGSPAFDELKKCINTWTNSSRPLDMKVLMIVSDKSFTESLGLIDNLASCSLSRILLILF